MQQGWQKGKEKTKALVQENKEEKVNPGKLFKKLIARPPRHQLCANSNQEEQTLGQKKKREKKETKGKPHKASKLFN